MISEKELIQILDDYKKEMESKEPNTVVLKSKSISIDSLKWLLTTLSTEEESRHYSITELKQYIDKLNPLYKDEDKGSYLLAKDLLNTKQKLNKIYSILKEINSDNFIIGENKYFINTNKFTEIFYEIKDILRE